MGKTIREYIKDVIVWWWVMFIGTILGGIQFWVSILRESSENKLPIVPLWIWIGLALLGFLIANFLAYHRMRLARDSRAQEVEKLRIQINNLAMIQVEEGKRLERINLRKPYLIMLPDVLVGIERQANILVNIVSTEQITENAEYGELSYYTSRIKNKVDNDSTIIELNNKLREINHNVGDPVLSDLMKDYMPALYEVLAHRCYSSYLRRFHDVQLEQVIKSGQVEDLVKQALDTRLARIGKRREELLMGVEIK